MDIDYSEVVRSNNVAVVTGGASGIGLACAREFTRRGMKVCLADRDAQALASAATGLLESCDGQQERIMTFELDVSQLAQLEALQAATYARFGQVNLLMNNAGIAAPSQSWSGMDTWRELLEVNLFGVIHGVQAFTQAMLDQHSPAMIINTGSKQGITNPPGSPGYNVSKAAVKAVTENLQHSLRSEDDCQVSAHLFVPGFVYSEMIQKFLPQKPPFAWTPEQTAAYLMESLERGDFYIICPDGEVTETMDRKRILWGAMDMVNNRPALSRWHPDYNDEFIEYMEKDLPSL
ncbi:MAG: SDR family NAD(P)-dependent oxidoreductase [Cellvibrionaceae bacterium]